MFRFYRNNKDRVKKSIEILFEICLYVVIFLGHKMEETKITYEYRVFFMLMTMFGVWLYSLKNDNLKNTVYDIMSKLLVPFLGALIIAKITGKIDMMDILPALYVTPIAFIYGLGQRKKIYKVNGKELLLTSSQFLKKKIGDYSIVPRISVYIISLTWVILNLPLEGFFIQVLFTEHIFNFIYLSIVERFIIQ